MLIQSSDDENDDDVSSNLVGQSQDDFIEKEKISRTL